MEQFVSSISVPQICLYPNGLTLLGVRVSLTFTLPPSCDLLFFYNSCSRMLFMHIVGHMTQSSALCLCRCCGTHTTQLTAIPATDLVNNSWVQKFTCFYSFLQNLVCEYLLWRYNNSVESCLAHLRRTILLIMCLGVFKSMTTHFKGNIICCWFFLYFSMGSMAFYYYQQWGTYSTSSG